MKGILSRIFWLGAVLCLAVAGMSAQGNSPLATSRVVISVSPSQAAAPTAEQLRFRVNGKPATITSIEPMRDAGNPLEIVVLVDSAARNGLQKQLGELRDFARTLPQGARITLAYILDDRLMLTTPLTSDPAVVDKGIQMPVAGGAVVSRTLSRENRDQVDLLRNDPGGAHTGAQMPSPSSSSLSSPYSVFKVLARNWPSNNTHARRIVVLVSNGIDPNQPEYNTDNVQVQGAIADATRAQIRVYSILLSWGDNSAGKNNLLTLTLATGGDVFGLATQGGASSFSNFYEQVLKLSQNQFLVQLATPIKFKAKEDVQPLDLKTDGFQGHIVAPKQTLLSNAAAAAK